MKRRRSRKGRAWGKVAKTIRRGFLALIAIPGHLLFVFFRFLSGWFASRPWRAILCGLPAFFAGVGVVALLAYAQRKASSERLLDYRRCAQLALVEKDYQLAALSLERVVYLDPADQASVYLFASVLDQLDESLRAQAIMNRLAPLDSPGYGPAHHWIAKNVLKQEQLAPSDLRTLEAHLKRAVAADPNQLEAHFLLGRLYVTEQRWKEAVKELRTVLPEKPELFPLLVQLCGKAGDDSDGKSLADQGTRLLSNRLKSQPDNMVWRVALAELHVLQNRHAEAERLFVGEDIDLQSVTSRQVLGGIYTAWFDSVSNSNNTVTDLQLDLLQRAIRVAPDDPRVLNCVESLVAKEPEVATPLRETLESALAQGKAVSAIHFILGTADLRSGKQEQGERHLSLAFAADPKMPAVANNLAWALANSPEPDLASAERMIEAAAELAPEHPEIRETRGQIYAKLGKTQEAISDLEYALSSMPNRTELHATLANLYERVGDVSMAEKHRNLSTGRE